MTNTNVNNCLNNNSSTYDFIYLADEALCVLDSKGIIVAINQQVCNLFNKQESDCLGKSYTSLLDTINKIRLAKSIKGNANKPLVISLEDKLYQIECISTVKELNGERYHIYRLKDLSALEQERMNELSRVCEFTIDNDYLEIFLVEIKNATYKQVSYNKGIRQELFRSEDYLSKINFIKSKVKISNDSNIDVFSLDNIIHNLNIDPLYTIHFSYTDSAGESRFGIVGIRYYDNEHNFLLFCVKDNTKQERNREFMRMALESAQKANNSKSDFLSRMSHDIRTPMNTIVGMCNIASLYLNDPKRIQECLSNIEISSRFLLSLINDILDMSKIESGKIDMRNEVFSINDLLRQLASICRHSANERNINFNISISQDLSEQYYGDALHLKQVLMNLLSNALKFTLPDTGRVRLDVKLLKKTSKEDIICFKVVDNGVGMSENFMKRMFLPFEQENNNKQGMSGTGLGLSISYNMVKLMNGIIDVDSELGKGATFKVEIPLKRVDTTASVKNTIKYSFTGMNALVIDDDLTTCEHTKSILEGINIKTDYSLSGREAIFNINKMFINKKYYDVIFVDWKMPEFDGIETTKQIRKIVGRDITIIVMSAYDWSSIEKQARNVGVDYFISKPMFKEDIFQLLSSISFTPITDDKMQREDFDKLFNKEKILLVEDNKLNREMMKALLQYNNLLVECAENGQDAIEKFTSSSLGEFKAILMDVRMPILDGLSATKIIRDLERPDAKDIPIFALSANAFSDDVRKFLDSGMNEHLSKPVDIKELNDFLIKYLYHKK